MTSAKYIGMDVHKETISIAVMNSMEKLLMESIIETKAGTILQFFAGLRGELHVTCEEGTWAAWLYDLQSDKPTKQHAVIDLFHQQALATNRVQHLQQLRSQQLFRRNRRTPDPGIHRVKPSRQLLEHFVHHGPDGAQRMILPHPLLRRQITEDMILLLIRSAHAFSYHTGLWIRSGFSAAC
jgi:hypothetical protein